MTSSHHDLFGLLLVVSPRDRAGQRRPLDALLGLIAAQLQEVESDIDKLYEEFLVETEDQEVSYPGSSTVGDADVGWIELEGGVQVNFGSGCYRAGDYWLIPARRVSDDSASRNSSGE